MYGERKITKTGDRVAMRDHRDRASIVRGIVLDIDYGLERALIQWDDEHENSYVWLDSALIREVNGQLVDEEEA